MTSKRHSRVQEFFDVGKLLEQITIPGANVAALIEGQCKNIQAVAEANRIGLGVWWTLVRCQAEILQDALNQAVCRQRTGGK